MKIKQYTANTLQEAILKVKNDLGRDAVILHTRRTKPGGIWGFFKREAFEVTASLDTRITVADVPKRESAVLNLPSVPDHRITALEEEFSQLRQTVELALTREPVKQQTCLYAALQEDLLHNDLDASIVDKLIRDVTRQFPEGQDMSAAKKYVKEQLIHYLSRVEGIKLGNGAARTVALLGPTGVGKTTTIAKLAAKFALVEGKKVALITTDTYRIAAVEQLKIYAEIIGVPVDVVFTRNELNDTLIRHADKDLILIDTAGRSPKNDKHLQELNHLLGEQPDLEIHLVVSATTKPREALDIVHKFTPAKGAYKLIVTKLDEADTLGAIVNIMHNSSAVLSYVTHGQSVPDDIELADPKRLTSLILRDY